MSKTQVGSDLIENYSLQLLDMASNFTGAVDWNMTDSAADATIIGLKDAVDVTSPATKGQLDSAVATLNASLNSFLEYKGGLDASSDTAFIALAHSKGDFYKITVSGSIVGETVNAGDNIYFKNDVLAGALANTDFDVVDSTEAADMLRDSDVVDSLLSQDASLVLSANQGYEIKALIDSLNSQVNSRKYGEQLTATQAVAVLPPLANVPVSGTVRIYRNGARMLMGSGNDVVMNYSTGVATFEYNLKSNDTILCDYEY